MRSSVLPECGVETLAGGRCGQLGDITLTLWTATLHTTLHYTDCWTLLLPGQHQAPDNQGSREMEPRHLGWGGAPHRPPNYRQGAGRGRAATMIRRDGNCNGDRIY